MMDVTITTGRSRKKKEQEKLGSKRDVESEGTTGMLLVIGDWGGVTSRLGEWLQQILETPYIIMLPLMVQRGGVVELLRWAAPAEKLHKPSYDLPSQVNGINQTEVYYKTVMSVNFPQGA